MTLTEKEIHEYLGTCKASSLGEALFQMFVILVYAETGELPSTHESVIKHEMKKKGKRK